MKIEALHQFHDKDFSQNWSDKFEPTIARLDLFETITNELRAANSRHILELGIGPGYLAKFILDDLKIVTYEGLDFSISMLDIAVERNSIHKNRISFTKGDLVNEYWPDKIKKNPDAIVSTWALHDLFSKDNISQVYQAAFHILPIGGILLNGDFIKPEESIHAYEGGRIKPSEHLNLLNDAGFKNVDLIKNFEVDVDNPTTANNYSCFKAIK